MQLLHAVFALWALQLTTAYTLYNTRPYYVARPISRNAQPQQCQSLPAPVLLLAERACGSPGALSEMPLVLVAQDSLQVVQDGQAQVRVAGFSTQLPFATVTGPSMPQNAEALRAVRVELRRPVLVSSLQSTLPFPDSFVVVHGADGAAAPLAIRAVVAPVPAGTVVSPARPLAIRVLYALPLDPFGAPLAPHAHRRPVFDFYDAPLYPSAHELIQYGYEDQQQLLPQPIHQVHPLQPLQHGVQQHPQQQYHLHFQSRPQFQVQHFQPQQQQALQPQHQPPQQLLPQQPQQQPQQQQPQLQQGEGQQKPGPGGPGSNLVTILDFPSAVATPESLFYQPEDPDSELGNRQPPQAVSPAGIVQSTQPQPNLSIFVNSKESAILQSLRDEAAKEKLAGLRGLQPQEQEAVNAELDSVVVDALRGTRSNDQSDADPVGPAAATKGEGEVPAESGSKANPVLDVNKAGN